uniref:Uncharacterized protein n=1 Tax=Setaria viridis TaxID=4556 RepID=A0A4U6V1E1_SETVI|nr:hypothetical protein SEVIR_4G187200v2 [Setaria viridis]
MMNNFKLIWKKPATAFPCLYICNNTPHFRYDIMSFIQLNVATSLHYSKYALYWYILFFSSPHSLCILQPFLTSLITHKAA